MATLTTDEMARIKLELGDTVLAVGAQPWIGIRSVWDVIAQYVESSAVAPTSSSTTIARTPPAARRTVTCVAPASSALSTSSRTTDAGRSTTSPAAI